LALRKNRQSIQVTLSFILLTKKTRAANAKLVLGEREPAYKLWPLTERESYKRICGDAMNLLGSEIPF
jgi:hypothetical protein